VAFVGGYALLGSPVIPFLEKIGYIPGKQYLWMDLCLKTREVELSRSARGLVFPVSLPCHWGVDPGVKEV
jgi:hypothetical protein